MNRRGFLTGLLAAPVVITTPGLLMPVRSLALPEPVFIPGISDMDLGTAILEMALFGKAVFETRPDGRVRHVGREGYMSSLHEISPPPSHLHVSADIA